MRPLVETEVFRPVFSELIDSKIAFVGNPGNIGDALIAEATFQLFDHFNISYKIANRSTFQVDPAVIDWADQIVYGGGGSMGSRYEPIYKLRQSLLEFRKALTIFPQSFFLEKENGTFHRIWVREKKSLEYCPNAKLAPDLALAYRPTFELDAPLFDVGIFLRRDTEATALDYSHSMGDPYQLCKSVEELFMLAAQFKTIYTNRLHFAIAALIAQREVFLLPNSYFKNEAVYQEWLAPLGCQWKNC